MPTLVEKTLNGINTTVFAYGVTGSGKTHTMMGSEDVNSEEAGLIPRICCCLVSILNGTTSRTKGPDDADVRIVSSISTVSFIEIYNEKVYDLLSQNAAAACRVGYLEQMCSEYFTCIIYVIWCTIC